MAAATKASPLVLGLGVLVLILLGASGYSYYALAKSAASLTEAQSQVRDLTTKLANSETDNAQLSEALQTEKERNDDFQNQIDDISGTVGKLDKLSKIDPELLEKYSKVFFLNENYIPSKLTQIPQRWVSNAEDEYFHAQAWPFLEDLLDAAKDDGINLTVVSGYRSFDKQKVLKGAYTVTYGTGANAFSADQGYSEHQLGTALDFSTKETGGALDGFQNTTAYDWLADNAYKYGFILSYPPNNTYYEYEPWHWRFVGKDLADYLHDHKKHFYDLDQRDIDTYLIDLFDN
jgi:D-alanyl-D-alanine carboxypeptidase